MELFVEHIGTREVSPAGIPESIQGEFFIQIPVLCIPGKVYLCISLLAVLGKVMYSGYYQLVIFVYSIDCVRLVLSVIFLIPVEEVKF